MENIEELGGKIFLIGFTEMDPGMKIVLKKIIGNYVRQIEEKNKDFEKITLELEGNSPSKIKTEAIIKGDSSKIEEEDKNLFFCLDRNLSRLLEQMPKEES